MENNQWQLYKEYKTDKKQKKYQNKMKTKKPCINLTDKGMETIHIE